MTSATLMKESIELEICPQFRKFSPLSWWGVWQQAGKHGAGEEAETYYILSHKKRERAWA